MLRAGLLVSLMIAGSAACAPPSTAGGTRTSNQIYVDEVALGYVDSPPDALRTTRR